MSERPMSVFFRRLLRSSQLRCDQLFQLFLLIVCFIAQPALASLPDFTRLVEQQGVAVVNISATISAENKLARLLPFPNFDESDPMFDFFRKLIPRRPGHPELPGREPEDESLGSGFIISADGYILTNAHVVDEAEEITVRLADKREFSARLIGADERSDVALLKIEASALPVVVLGDPGKLKVGEWVLAIGSPFGFEQSATAGIVSATGRALPDENFVPFIQTDVAINPGNSGGPLFNLSGEVVGMNSQIYSRTGGFMGLSFAIPIDVAMDVQQQLRSKGRVDRGRIGVAIQEVTRDLADGFGLPAPHGALVSSVEEDGPAAQAGIRQGDVIVRFAGKAVLASSDLPRIVAAVQPGNRAEVELYRDGHLLQLTLEVGVWEEDGRMPARTASKPKVKPANRLGLVLVQPTTAQKRERKLEYGLIIERVEGNAARAELRPGDVILALVIQARQHPLDSVETFDALLAELEPGHKLSALVLRGEQTSFVSLRVGE